MDIGYVHILFILIKDQINKGTGVKTPKMRAFFSRNAYSFVDFIFLDNNLLYIVYTYMWLFIIMSLTKGKEKGVQNLLFINYCYSWKGKNV